VKCFYGYLIFQTPEGLQSNIYCLGSDSLHSELGFFLQFPKEEERDKGVKRMVDWWKGDPTAKYMKVVDTETGKFQDTFQKI
jgi:hypothetical protein